MNVASRTSGLLLSCALGALAVLSSAGCRDEDEGPRLTFGVTPEQHASFPITRQAVHGLGRVALSGPIDCASCHGTTGSFRDFSCVGCHEHRETGVERNGSSGMNEVHAGLADYRYDSKACLSCHTDGLAGELSRPLHDEYFPIEIGTAHGTTSCAGCHSDPSSREVVTCTGCHTDADGDGFEDHSLLTMRNAHGPAMQELGYEWTTTKCLECHERSQDPGLLSHEPFPIAVDDVHDGVSCADCHASRLDRTQIACIGCHEQVSDGARARDVHGDVRMFELHEFGAVPGYAYESRACYSCHSNAQVPGELDHEALFPIGAASVHALNTLIDEPPTEVVCASCHQSETFADVTCTSCHAHAQAVTDPQHTGFPDYIYASASCVFCHKGGLRNFDHAGISDFPVSALTDSHKLDDPGTGTVDGLACADCHASQENRTQMRCTSCHEHEQPTELFNHGAELSRFGYAWDSGACLACHATSQVPGLIDHEPEFPLLPPSGNGGHQALSCADCHADRLSRSASLSCTTCHQPTSPQDDREVHSEPRLGEVHGSIPEYIWTAQSCIGCHADGTAAGAAQNLEHVWFPVDTGNTHALSGRGGSLACTDCHTVPGDYTVATIGCVSCHQQVNDNDGNGARDVHGVERLAGIHTGVDGYLHDGPTCLECHPNGEPTGNFAHVDFPIVVGSAHGGVSCTECHAAALPKSDLTGLQCKQCHDTTVDLNPTVLQRHSGIPGFVDASPSCYGCHPNAEPSPSFDHDGFFPIAAGTPHGANTCTDCHINPSVRAQVTCTGCHTDQNGDGLFDHDVSAMLAQHGPGMSDMGYAWNTAACRTCHARAEVPGLLNHEAAFPIALGTVHSGKQCLDCHNSKQDRTALTCTSCHQQVDDGAGALDVHGELRMEEVHVTSGTVPGYAFEPRACYACHQQAQVPGVMEHDAFFPIGATSFHPLGDSIDTPAVLVECITCHQDAANQRNVTCTGCHAHEQPLMDASHAGFPEYAWDSTSCVFCHVGGTKQLNHALVANFPVSDAGDSHKLDDPNTGALDGLLCSECHVSRTNRAQLACTSCHQHTVAQEDLDHGTAMSQYGYRYDSGACYACHETAQVPGLFDHEPIYPLLPPSGGTSHQALSCADCHASKANRAASLTCTTCHQPTSPQDAREVHSQVRLAEVHNGFPGYQWSPQSCVGCHTDGTAASAGQNLDHVWFPTDAGKTHALTTTGGQLVCADCHTNPNDFQVFECVQCHLNTNDNDGNGARATHGQPRMTDRHAGVNGFVFSSTECLACHPNGEPTGNFDHTGFPITAGSAHTGVTCTECHTGNAPKTDLNALGCAQCHATENVAPNTIAAIHNGVPGFVNTSPSCYTCHPNAEPVGPMEHGAYFPIAAGSMHASAAYMAKVGATQTSCSACHASRTDRTNELCATCHATVPVIPTSAHTAVKGFTNTSPNCKACHADAQLMRLTQHPKDGNKSWHTHENSKCQNCHINQALCLTNANCYNNNAGGQVNPAAVPAYRADKPWGYDFDKYGCLGCHEHKKSSMDNKHQGENDYISYGVPACISCHNP